jgi:hypothetical protein
VIPKLGVAFTALSGKQMLESATGTDLLTQERLNEEERVSRGGQGVLGLAGSLSLLENTGKNLINGAKAIPANIGRFSRRLMGEPKEFALPTGSKVDPAELNPNQPMQTRGNSQSSGKNSQGGGHGLENTTPGTQVTPKAVRIASASELRQRFASEIDIDAARGNQSSDLRRKLNDIENITDESKRAKELANLEDQLTNLRNVRDRSTLTQAERDAISRMPGGKEWLISPNKGSSAYTKEALLALEMQRRGEKIEFLGKEISRSGKKVNQKLTEVDIETSNEIIQVKSGDFSQQNKLSAQDMKQFNNTLIYARQQGKDKPVVFHFFGKVSPELRAWFNKKGVIIREGWDGRQ